MVLEYLLLIDQEKQAFLSLILEVLWTSDANFCQERNYKLLLKSGDIVFSSPTYSFHKVLFEGWRGSFTKVCNWPETEPSIWMGTKILQLVARKLT